MTLRETCKAIKYFFLIKDEKTQSLTNVSKISEFEVGSTDMKKKIYLKAHGSFILTLKIVTAYQLWFCIESDGRQKNFLKGNAYGIL